MRSMKVWVGGLLLPALVLSACSSLAGSDQNGLTASGAVEATEVRVAPELSGSVEQVFVERGDAVSAGDQLFQLNGDRLEAQERQAQAALTSAQSQQTLAQANLAAAESALESANLGLTAARLQAELSRTDAYLGSPAQLDGAWAETQPSDFDLPSWYFDRPDRISAASAEVDRAQASAEQAADALEALIEDLGGDDVAEAESQVAQARAELAAVRALQDRLIGGPESGELRRAIRDELEASRDSLDAAQSDLDDLLTDEQRDDLLSARAELAVALGRQEEALRSYYSLLTGEESLTVALAQLGIEQAELAIGLSQAGRDQARAQLAGADAAVDQAQAALAAVELELSKLVVTAPISGTVLTQSLQVGEVIQAGMAGITLGDLSDMHITVYLPEDRYGQVGLGGSAQVSVDSFPDEVFQATVTAIADEAEFTPRNVQTEEERQTTVYAVELAVRDPDGKLKPGMPADVEFDL